MYPNKPTLSLEIECNTAWRTDATKASNTIFIFFYFTKKHYVKASIDQWAACMAYPVVSMAYENHNLEEQRSES